MKANIDREVETIDPRMKQKANYYKNISRDAVKIDPDEWVKGPKYKDPDNERYINPANNVHLIRERAQHEMEEDIEHDDYTQDTMPTIREEIAIL